MRSCLQVAFLYVGGVMLFNGFIIQQSACSWHLLCALLTCLVHNLARQQTQCIAFLT